MSKKSSHGALVAARVTGRVVGGILKWFFAILGTLLLVGMLTASIAACYGAVYIRNVVLPQTAVELTTYSLGENTNIYYMNSDSGEYEVLRTLHAEESSSVWVDYSNIPENLLNATVAIEDKRFYQHQGVDWWRTLGAVKGLLTGSDSYGGSSITQQLIKNITGNDDVTVKRKVTEIFQALEFEKSHSKSEILEYYLNIIYLGEGCNGIGSAAQVYFGKDVSQLDLAECAALIGITNNPNKYDPLRTTVMKVAATDEEGNRLYDENGDVIYVDQTHEEANKIRQEAILRAMCNQGYITEEERDAAIAEKLNWIPRSSDEEETEDGSTGVFSWFEDALISQVQSDLEAQGYSSDAAKLLIYSGGLSIYTTLDPQIQNIVDEVYSNIYNFNYPSSNGQQLQSSMTIIDNNTGAVVAIVGGVGEKTGSLVYNRATQAKRQPGSSIKPLSAYAPLMESGALPSSVYDDVPLTYDEETETAWPSNSYRYYNGLMTMTEAARVSSNAATVQMIDTLGLETSFNFLRDHFGITTLIESRTTSSGLIETDLAYGPLALGGLTSGVTNLEMASAYASFARSGVYNRGYFYTSVTGSDGTVLLENSSQGEQAVSSSTAFYMTQMLENVVLNGTGRAAQIAGVNVAGKTGTTTNNYDRWFCGYTPYYTAATWCGYESNEKINTTTNVSTMIWQLVMSRIHANLNSSGADFVTPGETVTVTYCLDSGDLPSSACKADQRGRRTSTGVFLVGDEPDHDCTVHTYVDVCTYASLGNGIYKLAGSGVSSYYKKTVSVLDIQRDYEAIGILPNDYQYTLPWLLLQGYAGYNSTYDIPEYEEEDEAEEDEEDTQNSETPSPSEEDNPAPSDNSGSNSDDTPSESPSSGGSDSGGDSGTDTSGGDNSGGNADGTLTLDESSQIA